MGLQFDAEYFPSVMSYMKEHPHEQIHVSHAIDYDVIMFLAAAKEDALLAHQLLDMNGFFYLASGPSDILFNRVSTQPYSRTSDLTLMREFIKTSKEIADNETQIATTTRMPRSYITK